MTTTIRNNKSVTNMKLAVLQESRELRKRLELCDEFLNKLGGIRDIQLAENKPRKNSVYHKGAPDELFNVLKKHKGEFTVDTAVNIADDNNLDLDRTQIMNGIQALIRQNKIKVVIPGLGRRVASYKIA